MIGSPASLDPPQGGTGNNRAPALYDACWGDSPYQRRYHDRAQRQRSQIVGSLLAQAEIEEIDDATGQETRSRKLANKLLGCARHPQLYEDLRTGTPLPVPHTCKSRICPRCGQIRRHRLMDRLRELLKLIDDPRLLTLTLRSTAEPLATQLDQLKRAWTRLRRRKDWKAHVWGGVSVVEVTWNPQTRRWHPHLHVVLDGCYWAQREISQAWLEVTGHSPIVDIRRVPDRKALANYVAKYVAKSDSADKLPPAQLPAWAHATHGRRLVQPFGRLHGVPGDKQAPDQKPDLQPLCPINPLHERALAGHVRPSRIYKLLTAWRRRQLSHDSGKPDDHLLRQGRSVTRRVRAWWASFQEHHSDRPPPRPPTRPAVHRPDDRPQRLWKESGRPPDPRCYGV